MVKYLILLTWLSSDIAIGEILKNCPIPTVYNMTERKWDDTDDRLYRDAHKNCERHTKGRLPCASVMLRADDYTYHYECSTEYEPPKEAQ